FAEGATFKGMRSFRQFENIQDLTLVVKKRDGLQFEGALTIVNRKDGEVVRTVRVTGTAPISKGTVEFVTDQSGLFKCKFSGQFANGELGFRWSGTGQDGVAYSGSGTLK